MPINTSPIAEMVHGAPNRVFACKIRAGWCVG